MKHILIDYENIQPKNLEGIEVEDSYVWLFLGVNQQKSLPLALVETLLRFDNEKVSIIKIQHTGKNALDFYLSFYLGKISEIDPKADVCILARDSGYDVLVDHLNNFYDMNIYRLEHTNTVSLIRKADNIGLNIDQSSTVHHFVSTLTIDETKPITTSTLGSKKNIISSGTIYQQAVSSLTKRPIDSRPSKKAALVNYLKSHLRNEDLKVINNIIKQMIANRVIIISSIDKITYHI